MLRLVCWVSTLCRLPSAEVVVGVFCVPEDVPPGKSARMSGVVIAPSSSSAATPTAGLQIAVQDTGEGIAPEHMPNVFERFYRADYGRSRQAGEPVWGWRLPKPLSKRTTAESVSAAPVYRGRGDIDYSAARAGVTGSGAS